METKTTTENPNQTQETTLLTQVSGLAKQVDPKDEFKDQINDLYKKVTSFVDNQNLPENLKVATQKLDPQNLAKVLNILNSELLGDYVHIRKLDSKQLTKIIMNYGCLYGRCIDENFKIRLSDQCLFQDLPENYEIPAKAILAMEKPDIIAQEFSNLKQIELNKNGIFAIEFTQGIPIIFNSSEEYKSTTVSALNQSSNSKIVFGGYYHPKGSIILREIMKELSNDAKNFFQENEVVTLEKAQEFFKVFGVMVPTEVVIGGELSRSEEIKQDTKQSGETKEKGGKLKLLGLVQTWLFSIGYANQSKKDIKETTDKINQQLRFEANGGDEKYITDATKWINSLNNPETWKVIRVNAWKYTYEYLHPNIADQFRKLMQAQIKPDPAINNLEQPQSLLRKIGSNIKLSNHAPYSLCVYNNSLYAFFSHAVHILSLPNLQDGFKAPVPWKYLKSTTILKGFIYASTCEGIMKIDPETLKITPVKIQDKEIPMCLILAYNDHLYAFLDKVVKINPETGESEVITSSGSWASATCGFVQDHVAYIVLSGYGNIWSLDLENKTERKIAGSWGYAQAMFANPNNVDEAFIYLKQLYKLDLKNGKYEIIEDHKYPELLCGAIESGMMYIATKPDPQGKTLEKICLYQVKSNGSREPLSVEWSSNFR